MSDEDVWPKWLWRWTKQNWPEGTGWEHQARGTTWLSPDKLQVLVNRVCATTCNNGWMSDLEVDAKPILTPLIEGKTLSIELAPEKQRIMAFWAVKTALIIDLVLPKADRVMRPEYYAGLFAQRRPSDNTTIWTAAYQRQVVGYGAHFGRVTMTTLPTYTRDGVLQGGNTHAIGAFVTFYINMLVFQILLYGGKRDPAIFGKNYPFAHRIWPVNATVYWPPDNSALSEEAYLEFVQRDGVVRTLPPVRRIIPPFL